MNLSPHHVVALRARLRVGPRTAVSTGPFAKLPPDFRDLLAEFDRERVEHAVIGGYERVRVRIIALHDLIANKRAAARPQDLADVARLEEIAARSSG